MQNREHILFIKGSACPHDDKKIAVEFRQYEQSYEALEDAGHQVTLVGNPADGFRLSQVKAKLAKNPDIDTVIVDAHGNVSRDKHFMQYAEFKDHKRGRIYADVLYSALAEAAGDRPLNVFNFSCGSGNGCVEAIKHLPLNSTLVNFVVEGDLYSYVAKPESFGVPLSPNKIFAEELFLNLMCCGFGKAPQMPQVSVCAERRDEIDVWSLWDLARMHVLGDPSRDGQMKRAMRRQMNGYTSNEKISQAFATMELYMKSYGHTADLKSSKTPVVFPAKPDHDGFKDSAIKNELMGVMCAMGYLANRGDIGAFQREVTRPPVDEAARTRSRAWLDALVREQSPSP